MYTYVCVIYIYIYIYIYFTFFFKKFIYFERESTPGRGAEREERVKIPSKLCPGSAEPDAGLELTNCEIMT